MSKTTRYQVGRPVELESVHSSFWATIYPGVFDTKCQSPRKFSPASSLRQHHIQLDQNLELVACRCRFISCPGPHTAHSPTAICISIAVSHFSGPRPWHSILQLMGIGIGVSLSVVGSSTRGRRSSTHSAEPASLAPYLAIYIQGTCELGSQSLTASTCPGGEMYVISRVKEQRCTVLSYCIQTAFR
jgi:hypothetical protein